MSDHKIAIIIPSPNYKIEDYSSVISTITDWEVVNDDTLRILLQGQYKNGYVVLELPDQAKFIARTVSDWEKKLLADKKADEKRKRVEEEKKRKAKEKILAKTAKDRRELLEKLKQEFGEA